MKGAATETLDPYGCGKALLGSFYKSIVYIDALTHACYDESDDDDKEEHIGSSGGIRVNLLA